MLSHVDSPRISGVSDLSCFNMQHVSGGQVSPYYLDYLAVPGEFNALQTEFSTIGSTFACVTVVRQVSVTICFLDVASKHGHARKRRST